METFFTSKYSFPGNFPVIWWSGEKYRFPGNFRLFGGLGLEMVSSYLILPQEKLAPMPSHRGPGTKEPGHRRGESASSPAATGACIRYEYAVLHSNTASAFVLKMSKIDGG